MAPPSLHAWAGGNPASYSQPGGSGPPGVYTAAHGQGDLEDQGARAEEAEGPTGGFRGRSRVSASGGGEGLRGQGWGTEREQSGGVCRSPPPSNSQARPQGSIPASPLGSRLQSRGVERRLQGRTGRGGAEPAAALANPLYSESRFIHL